MLLIFHAHHRPHAFSVCGSKSVIHCLVFLFRCLYCSCTWMEGGGVKAMVMGHLYCDHSMIYLLA